jgi:hypothetical protein
VFRFSKCILYEVAFFLVLDTIILDTYIFFIYFVLSILWQKEKLIIHNVAGSDGRAVRGTYYWNTGIMGSNPARGMDVCPNFSMLCCPVLVVALRRADPPSKEFCQMSKNIFINSRSQILNRRRPEDLIRIYLFDFLIHNVDHCNNLVVDEAN